MDACKHGSSGHCALCSYEDAQHNQAMAAWEAEEAALRHTTAIEHCGDLRGLSDAEALMAIRRIILSAWGESENVERMRRMVSAVLRAADAGGATHQPHEPA